MNKAQSEIGPRDARLVFFRRECLCSFRSEEEEKKNTPELRRRCLRENGKMFPM